MDKILFCSSLLLFLVSFILFGICFLQMKRTYQRLSFMLDKAIGGTFEENQYNESELSKLEVKWKQFLTTSALSHKKIEEERQVLQSLISDISHQTKTSLANIKLYAELLEETLKEQEKQEVDRQQVPSMYLEQMNIQIEKLSFLLLSLVKMSRIESGTYTYDRKEQSVHSLAIELREEFLLKAREQGIMLSVHVEETGEESKAKFDWKWTKEAIENIIDNSIKYTAIKKENEEKEQKEIVLNIKNYESFVCLQIKDNGIGISEEEQGKIFTRFYRGKNVRQQNGVGLGLTLARQIIVAQDGYMKVESELHKGSTFFVYLSKN